MIASNIDFKLQPDTPSDSDLTEPINSSRFFLPVSALNCIVSPSKRDALAPLLAAAGVRTVAANWQVRRTSTLLRLHIFTGRYGNLVNVSALYY